jgi:hypothetical protein
MTGRDLAKALLFSAAVLFLASPARADAIDGEWCSTTEVAHFSIAGPLIVTPAGTQATGDYSRHAFSYVVPAGDPGAGETIKMRLLNEEEVLVAAGAAEPKLWRRCEVIS